MQTVNNLTRGHILSARPDTPGCDVHHDVSSGCSYSMQGPIRHSKITGRVPFFLAWVQCSLRWHLCTGIVWVCMWVCVVHSDEVDCLHHPLFIPSMGEMGVCHTFVSSLILRFILLLPCLRVGLSVCRLLCVGVLCLAVVVVVVVLVPPVPEKVRNPTILIRFIIRYSSYYRCCFFSLPSPGFLSVGVTIG